MQKAYVSFVPNSWLEFSPVVQMPGEKPRHALYVLITNGNKGARLSVELFGHDEEYRSRMKMVAQQNPAAFPGLSNKKSDKFTTLFSLPLVTFEGPEDDTGEDLVDRVNAALDAYLLTRLPEQTKAFLAI